MALAFSHELHDDIYQILYMYVASVANIHKLISKFTSTHTPVRSVEVTLEKPRVSANEVYLLYSPSPPRLCEADSSFTTVRLSSCKSLQIRKLIVLGHNLLNSSMKRGRDNLVPMTFWSL